MKIAILGDVHWSQYSSILRMNASKYSLRLENLIQSVNWFNNLSKLNNCSFQVYLGDFFDKPDLNSKEITALKEIKWNNTSNYFLCGNHEMGQIDHLYSSTDIFTLLPNSEIIKSPSLIDFDSFEICFLPYVLEENRSSIIDYFPEKTKKRIIFSHNDLKGIQLGKFLSKTGFSISDIENNCDLFINGHLHNGDKITDKVINIGNCTGQNFSENALKYDHCAFILDTDTFQVAVFENPFAFNFYKYDLSSTVDVDNMVNDIKQNAVISIKCEEQLKSYVDDCIKNCNKVIEYRITLIYKNTDCAEVNIKDLQIDHLQEFKNYLLDNYEHSDILYEEISRLCGDIK